MAYEQWGVRELQEECRRRGLPTARAKADMAQRLTGDDAATFEGSSEPPAQDPFPDAAPDEPAREGPSEGTQAPMSALPPAVFQCRFPAQPGGPDEETHLAHRLHTRQAAAAAGLTPRGDAHRLGTVDGHDLYEVHVRRPS